MPPIKKKPMTADEIRALEHDFIGPTWKVNLDGSWLLPERTLGWEIAAWTAKYLLNEEGGRWKFTLEQLRFILWWYAMDERGRFVYRKGVLQRMKGWGKDPLLAVLCLVELVGPSQFSHWDTETGKPVGKPHRRALVQISAVNQEQTQNTMDYIPGLISERMLDEYGMRGKVGAEIIRANGGKAKLVAVTSSYRALEGKRTTFTLLNETHHWIAGNQGHKMHETIERNVAKMGGRWLAITNAFQPGEDSVAERIRRSWQAIQDGRAEDIGLLYDSIEAHPKTPLTAEAVRIVLPIIRGDAIWLDPENVLSSVLDTSLGMAGSRRMWYNQIVADGDMLVPPELWKPLEREDAVLRAGDEIVLGFDGGKTDDSTALVALRVIDRVAFVLCLEEKPEGPAGDDWMVNTMRVDSAVHDAFRLYKVRAFYADVAEWESHIDDWAEEYREQLTVKASEQHAVAWDMRQSLQRITRAHERLLRSIHDQKIFHDGDPDLRRHVYNACRRANKYGVSFGKESRESPRKVDAYAALLLAHEALHDLRTRKHKNTKERTGRGGFY